SIDSECSNVCASEQNITLHALKIQSRNIATSGYLVLHSHVHSQSSGGRRITRYEAAASSQPPIQPSRDTKHQCHRAQSRQWRRQMNQGSKLDHNLTARMKSGTD